jgi:hypothetical protein
MPLVAKSLAQLALMPGPPPMINARSWSDCVMCVSFSSVANVRAMRYRLITIVM